MSSVPSLCAHICYTETVKAPPSLGVPDLPPARPALCVSRPQPVSTPRQGATNLDFKSIVTVTVTLPRLPPYHPFKVECKVDFFFEACKIIPWCLWRQSSSKKAYQLLLCVHSKTRDCSLKGPCSCRTALLTVPG